MLNPHNTCIKRLRLDPFTKSKSQLDFQNFNWFFLLQLIPLASHRTRKNSSQGISAHLVLEIRSWNFNFRRQIPLRGKSFGKVLEWYVGVKGFGLAC